VVVVALLVVVTKVVVVGEGRKEKLGTFSVASHG
jgi:hypothetical protein